MNRNREQDHPTTATRLMALELISNLLAVSRPQELGRRLTEQLRELTGALTVLLIAHQGGSEAHEVLHACPERRAMLFRLEELHLFCPEHAPEPLPRRAAELPPDHPLREPLSRAGIESMLRFPLNAGGEFLGVLLLLDLPALERIDEAAEIIALLCPPISLALRNALAFDQIERQRREIQRHAGGLEERVKERTAELAAANEDLAASRLAALNMMEDAVAARQRAEDVNAALRHEIVERQRAEEEILRLNRELDQRVRDRTAHLEAAIKELESFAYSVSHDLRAPLRAIDGFSQALLDDCATKLDEEGQQHLHRVRAAAQRMGHLIDDMLSLSRVTRGELRMEKVNLSSLAREIAGELARREPGRTVDFAIAPEVVVTGDARFMRVALENLLGNAWKFTSKRPEAKIEFGVTDQEGRAVYFVRDNGAGFDMEYVGKLFGAFQRLHSPEEFPGTGVGLATVQRILHRHGGRIWAEAEINCGATFYFSLPRPVLGGCNPMAPSERNDHGKS